jgi:hypothetical protein
MLRVTFPLLLFTMFSPSLFTTMVLGVSVTPPQWEQLGQQVGGRLYAGAPFASPCFANGNDSTNSANCAFVEAGYTDECMILLS